MDDRGVAAVAMCHVLPVEYDWLVAEHIAGLAADGGARPIRVAVTKREAARGQRPGIILCNVKLLEGMGPKAIETIMQEAGSIPVIFATGTPEDGQPCEPYGSGSASSFKRT